MSKQSKRNKYFFGLGTIGRDMFYAFESNALLYFLSNILNLLMNNNLQYKGYILFYHKMNMSLLDHYNI